MLFAVYLLFRTAMTDPGIIPRKENNENLFPVNVAISSQQAL
jgi:hypothetical protein